MRNIEVFSLPKISFAHVCSVDTYFATLPYKQRKIEITYIAEGQTNITVNNVSYDVKKGDVICFLREEVDICCNAPHSHHTVQAAFDFDFSNDEVNSLHLPFITKAEQGTLEICNLIDEFIFRQSIIQSKTKSAIKFLNILYEIDKCYTKTNKVQIPSNSVYSYKAKKYIRKFLERPITQNEVAQHLGISQGHLCKVFKSAEGISLMKYINKTKLENIKALMDNSNVKLYDAAAMYGYSDPNYVSKLYKQIFGHNITDKTE